MMVVCFSATSVKCNRPKCKHFNEHRRKRNCFTHCDNFDDKGCVSILAAEILLCLGDYHDGNL